MKSIIATLMAAVCVAAAGQAAADEALAKSKNCMSCHAIDKKVVGPAYKDVAAKYRGDPKAAATLAEKVLKGGKGVWGEIPMPPNTAVTPDEARKLVAWVLGQK